MFSYEGKKAVVTGAGRGIGRAIALDFAECGADLVLAARTETEIEAVAEEIRALGRQAWAFTTDASDLDQGLGLVEKAREAMGHIDVWVNNAGGGPMVPGVFGPLSETSVEGFDALYQLNVRVPFFMARAAAEHMATRDGGAILVVSILRREMNALMPESAPAVSARTRLAYARIRESDDLTEGVAAFREKRKPDFKGK